MGKIDEPMLAATLVEMKDVKYPAYATPKLDGIRCLVVDGEAVTRNFKSFPNRHVRKMVSQLPEGFDGEIVCGKKKFNEVSHLVMSEAGEPDFVYAVFDYMSGDASEAYSSRMVKLQNMKVPKFVKKILPTQVNNETELLAFEKQCLDAGYEGVILRRPDFGYKMGRSTCREFGLVKLKRFSSDEAIIIGFEEQMENMNAKIDGERTMHKSGMVPKGTLGAVMVRDLKSKIEFGIGSGFDNSTRDEIWANRENYMGKIVTYKHQKSGAKSAPRFPTFVGFRNKELDM